MVEKALVICAGGISSSMITKRTMILLQEQGNDIGMDTIDVPEGQERIKADKYDLYLASPQTKVNFKQLVDATARTNEPIVQIPPQAYIPIPMGIEEMAVLVKKSV